MIYYIPGYEHEADTLETAQDFLIELCEKHGEVEKPTNIWLTSKDQYGDIQNPQKVWRAACYVSVEGGPYYAANHPDNGDDPEYDVDLTELCPECDGKGMTYKRTGHCGYQVKCTACKGAGTPQTVCTKSIKTIPVQTGVE